MVTRKGVALSEKFKKTSTWKKTDIETEQQKRHLEKPGQKVET